MPKEIVECVAEKTGVWLEFDAPDPGILIDFVKLEGSGKLHPVRTYYAKWKYDLGFVRAKMHSLERAMRRRMEGV